MIEVCEMGLKYSTSFAINYYIILTILDYYFHFCEGYERFV